MRLAAPAACRRRCIWPGRCWPRGTRRGRQARRHRLHAPPATRRNFRLQPTRQRRRTAGARSPTRLRRYLWEPLCLAALEHRARTGLGADLPQRAARQPRPRTAPPATCCCRPATSRPCFPSRPPDSSTAAAAASSAARASTRLTRIARRDSTSTTTAPYPQVILAVAPQHLPTLVAELARTGRRSAGNSRLRLGTHRHLLPRLPGAMRLPRPMLGVADGTGAMAVRSRPLPRQPGPSPPSSAPAGDTANSTQQALAAAIHAEIAAHRAGPATTGLEPGHHRAARHLRLHARRAATADCDGAARPLAGRRLRGQRLPGDHRRCRQQRHRGRALSARRADPPPAVAPGRNGGQRLRRASPAPASCRPRAFMANIRSMISPPVAASRLPVGSSASSSLGCDREGARQRDALLLAAGQVLGIVVQALGQADAREHASACAMASARPQVPAAARRSPAP